jgi:tRNA-Thr(GGU) m(6)t(6)A37 methyltransferase TsaA
MTIHIEPIGFVESSRTTTGDDNWGGAVSCVALRSPFAAEALSGLDEFSHVEVLYYFHQADPSRVVTGARHPRNNAEWPKVGIFAQRAKNRPNRIGSTICHVLRLEDTRLYVSELDAIDGTPVIDLKPVMAEFLPRGELRQPAWSHELMERYWLRSE